MIITTDVLLGAIIGQLIVVVVLLSLILGRMK